MATFTPIVISQTQDNRIVTLRANLDSAFGAGVNVSGTTVNINAGDLVRTGTAPAQIVTARTQSAHSLIVGDQVFIQMAATDSNFASGGKYVQTVPDANHFTYNEQGTNASSSQSATATEAVAPISGYSDDGLFSNGTSGGPDTPPGAAAANRAAVKQLSLSLIGALMQNFKLTQLITNHGGLPGSTSFSTGGGTVLMMASGSGYTSTIGTISVTLSVDSAAVGTLQLTANEVSSHKAFVPIFIVLSGLAAGTHSLTFAATSGTIVDGNDPYNVTLLEIPV